MVTAVAVVFVVSVFRLYEKPIFHYFDILVGGFCFLQGHKGIDKIASSFSFGRADAVSVALDCMTGSHIRLAAMYCSVCIAHHVCPGKPLPLGVIHPHSTRLFHIP